MRGLGYSKKAMRAMGDAIVYSVNKLGRGVGVNGTEVLPSAGAGSAAFSGLQAVEEGMEEDPSLGSQ
jgi:hypothetical protein